MSLHEAQRERARGAWHDFHEVPLGDVLGREAQGDAAQAALDLFHEVAASVPAYREFLTENGVNIDAIRTSDDFGALPLVTKQNYLNRYPLPQLCRHGRLEGCDMIAVSSGSTGNPTFWPRFLSDELQIARRFEQVFHDSFEADRRRTMAVVCFALGTWVGGMYTAACCRHLAAKGYPITVVTPGNKSPDIHRIVQELGPHYDQVVLLGYPPFIKDVIDSGIAAGVEWSRYGIKTVLAGEVFSEEWRSLIAERTGATAICHASASLYGTADAGVLGNETPLSIAIRRWLAANPAPARELFGESRLPTLVQYDPYSRYFEVHEGTLLFTGDNGVPLVRYQISDQGGIMAYDDMLAFLRQHGFDPVAELGRKPARGVHALPFVWVFGRSHFTVSYYGANIYPENVTVGLEQPLTKAWVTGKFVLQVREDADRNRHLFVAVELAPGIVGTGEMAERIAASIESELLRLNGEFANYVPAENRRPHVDLLPTGDPEYFPVGVKHRYTRQSAA